MFGRHKILTVAIIVLVLLFTVVYGGIWLTGKHTGGTLDSVTPSGNMQVTSTSFDNNQVIPNKYGYRFDNVSPQLSISGLPQNTKSLAIIMHDPDSPSGDWLHWSVWNISPDTTAIAEGSVPKDALQGTNDFGSANYGGPAPHDGTHHYVFDVYALDSTINLPQGASRQQLEQAIDGHILDKAQLTGLFSA